MWTPRQGEGSEVGAVDNVRTCEGGKRGILQEPLQGPLADEAARSLQGMRGTPSPRRSGVAQLMESLRGVQRPLERC